MLRKTRHTFALLLSVIFIFICGCDTSGVTEYPAVSDIPQFDSQSAYVEINGNIPSFAKAELSKTSYERYSPLDSLGRCGVCEASVGVDIMPTEERGAIGQVKPCGWHTVKYDCVDGKYLYNRCHLIGYQLTGENANERNLITGTRYLNTEGMLPFENMVADYVKETKNHVMYRVTPIYSGDNLIANGVQMEGFSVEDNGKGVCFNVYAYNAQPGVSINYVNGDSKEGDNKTFDSVDALSEPTIYIINKGTKKFHKKDCGNVTTIKPQNKKETSLTRDELISQGYSPCKACNP